MTARILVVEDEAPVLQGLSDLLRAKGYAVLTAMTGPEGLLKATDASPDLVLLDVMLPGMSGFEVLRTLRGRGSRVPVVMLTAKGAEVDKVLGFELGVDDYVTKPFSILELLGRIGAVLRRASEARPVEREPRCIGRAEVDFAREEVRRDGEVVSLPPRAIEVLHVLARAEGRNVSRDQLIDEVWGKDQWVNPRTIDNLVVKLRQAIEADPGEPEVLLTVHGKGYRLKCP